MTMSHYTAISIKKVKTSLSADGKCVKKFRPMTQPGTINSIRFAFKTSRPGQDMMMVLLQNQGISNGDTEKEFLAVELRDGRVRFTWNVGGGIGVVTDNKKVVSEVSTIKESEKWYRVKAERIGGLGRLTVHRLSDTAGAPITNTSTVGFSLMGLDDTTDIFVSGVPQDVIVYPSLTSRNFSGCMGDMHIDETLVGLFNFERNTMDSCSACLEVPSQPPAANVYSFDGTGYAVTDKNRFLSPLIANIILDFKTYWDNASLFFVGNPQTSEFMAIELENGFVVFKYYLGQGSYGRIQSEMKYNRNQWVSVAAAHSGLLAVLEVSKVESLITQGNPGDHLLNVSMNDLFFGGIPPSVNLDIYRKGSGHHVSGDSFLGCMRSLQLSSNAVNLWDGKSTIGVLEGCKESGLRSIGFYGSGFAEYQGVSMISSESDLSISFSTTEPDGLLLLAKNVNGDSYYSLVLKDGLVYGKFSGGRNPISINSKERYNDGKVHTVAVRKLDRKIEIYVDDKVVATGNLDRQLRDIAVREDGGLYLGGVPEGLNVDDQAETSKSLDGCLSDVVINRGILNINQPKKYDRADIGRCKLMEMQHDRMLVDPEPPLASDAPSNISPSQPPAANVYSFDGTGYAVTDKNRFLSPLIANIILDFKTYWDNASLFFVGNPQTSEFMAIELENGFVVFKYYLGQGSYGRIQSEMKYNRNQWVSVAAARSGLLAVLKVSKVESLITQGNPGDRLLNVSMNDLFFGGIPPSVNLDIYRKGSGHHVSGDSFLGCMRSLQLSSNAVNLWDGKSTIGVLEGCKESGLRSIGFYGSGFAEYQGVSMISSESDLSISFSTTEPDGLLLLAKNVNGDSYYSLALKDGLVYGKFSGGRNPISINSKERYNDGKVHNVAVRKLDRKIEIYVDDKVVATGNLDRQFRDIAVREDGGLYLGGVPEGLNVDDQAETSKSLDGCLSDVVINRGKANCILNINQPKKYDRADIGRCKLMEMQHDRMLVDPEPPLASDAPSNIRMLEVEPMSRKVKPTKNSLQDKMGTPTSGPTPCATVARSVDFQVDALTFGEADMSFHQINTSKKEILRKFEISLDFRTFYQNGLLIYLSNLDHTEFVAAQIKDHVLVLVLTRNDDIKVVTVNTSTSLADGQWHNVKVDKNLQRISVVVDGNEENMGSRKIAKVLKVEPPLFIGGVPSSFKPLLNENVVAHSVRGCIRGLKIDGDSRPSSEATLASGVEKCYAKVEKGAYFNGEAWGLYDDKFSVGQKFKMELDFRTNKADGILVNITSQNLKNSIGLEISKGKVIFTAVIAGQQFSLKSQNGFCDNVWHKVKVGMEKRTIAMQVDDGEIYQDTLAGDITLSNLRAPLYLGATPDVFAKVASSRHRGYQGCMRDVIINNKQVNWFDLQRSFSLQKTACPVA
ncbi:hypothetical protein DPMN_084551 [Dreissena polymorpha]|uniref:Laminin G domain-containing protein n=1 Tax=Dreissena polymorpha TaxID=45954 RepID=A0A9D3YDC0_DREPO|nr:hypothetical protein DPMN_084551 [Dreissena polymorpha]